MLYCPLSLAPTTSIEVGKKRQYLAQRCSEFYPDRPDLADTAATELQTGWWMGTNYSRRDTQKIIDLAKEVARPEAGATMSVRVSD